MKLLILFIIVFCLESCYSDTEEEYAIEWFANEKFNTFETAIIRNDKETLKQNFAELSIFISNFEDEYVVNHMEILDEYGQEIMKYVNTDLSKFKNKYLLNLTLSRLKLFKPKDLILLFDCLLAWVNKRIPVSGFIREKMETFKTKITEAKSELKQFTIFLETVKQLKSIEKRNRNSEEIIRLANVIQTANQQSLLQVKTHDLIDFIADLIYVEPEPQYVAVFPSDQDGNKNMQFAKPAPLKQNQ